MVYFFLKLLQKNRVEREKELAKQSSSHSKDVTNLSAKSNKCRLCLLEGSIQIHENPDLNIVESINLITGLEVRETDDLPHFICRKCFKIIHKAWNLRKTALESDTILKQLKTSVDSDTYQDQENEYCPDFSDDELDNDEYKPPAVNKKPAKKEKKAKTAKKSRSSDTEYQPENKLYVKEEKPKEKKKVPCKICNKVITKSYYKEHLALHGHGTPKQKPKVDCRVCGKTLELAYYKYHLSLVHGKGKERSKYVCYVCGKTFKYQTGYKSHILSHKDEFPFICHLCPYKGRHKGLLKTHMRVHTRDYRFQCSTCPARFLTSGNLNKHMLKHMEKKYKCDSCSRAFHTQSEMEKHIQVDHLGIKNHVCNICDKAFGYRSAMMKHQLHVHKRQKLLNGRVPSYIEAERRKQDPKICENSNDLI